ncbi:MAG TPA: response regulator transcription factor [Chloroflexi bacterium]|jgi:DNA-binding response OmpR family regulator|nr:response regulator transcription factor [Chloroflexota bacterium]
MDILFIAGDITTRDLLTQMFHPRQAKITYAPNLQQGLRLARQADFSLSILDDGNFQSETIRFCQEFRRLNGIPLLVLSAQDDPNRIATILDAGADYYLVKPVPRAILEATINTLLRRCQPSQPLITSWGDHVSML